MVIALLSISHDMRAEDNQNQLFGRLIESGLERVSTDHEFLVQAFSRVLDSLGITRAANLLQTRNFSDQNALLEPPTIQAISFYFQLLNLVEEHGSGRSSREREKELGGDAEPGRWGRYLKQLSEAGFSEQEVREKLRQVRVEPVFTKHPTEAKLGSIGFAP